MRVVKTHVKVWHIPEWDGHNLASFSASGSPGPPPESSSGSSRSGSSGSSRSGSSGSVCQRARSRYDSSSLLVALFFIGSQNDTLQYWAKLLLHFWQLCEKEAVQLCTKLTFRGLIYWIYVSWKGFSSSIVWYPDYNPLYALILSRLKYCTVKVLYSIQIRIHDTLWS